MSLKRSDKNTNGNGASADAGGDSPKLRDNVEINAKIDAYIQANPKEWNYIQGLPRERLERMLVLQNVNKIERRERIRASVTKQLNANPELKEAYRKLVKNLPAEQQEKVPKEVWEKVKPMLEKLGPGKAEHSDAEEDSDRKPSL